MLDIYIIDRGIKIFREQIIFVEAKNLLTNFDFHNKKICQCKMIRSNYHVAKNIIIYVIKTIWSKHRGY